MKIEVQPVGDVTILTIYLPVRSYCGRSSELNRARRIGEALVREQHRRAEVLGLRSEGDAEMYYPGAHLVNDCEASFSLSFYHFTAKKDARKLRTKLLEEMILFVTMHRDIVKWAEETA